MNVSREDVALLERRRAGRSVAAALPVVEAAGVLTVFVPGRPRHPLNGTLAHAHWSKRTKWAKGWRERASTAVLRYRRPAAARLTDVMGVLAPAWPWKATAPKRITFTIHGPSRFDDDNLRAVCKPVRDALKDMAVIDDDRPSASHTFEYAQAKPTRKAGAVHGIAIKVELAAPPDAATDRTEG